MNRRLTIGLMVALTQLLACGGSADDCTQLRVITYPDADGDGYGGDSEAEETCGTPAGRTQSPGDCDDTVSSINIGGVEICDGVDNDCDDETDEGLAATEWFTDGDGDGYGTASGSIEACALPDGYAATADDCDDSVVDINPGATEVCDGADNDCDGDVDQDDESLDLNSLITFYADFDGDTFGDPNVFTEACQPMGNMVDNGEDCDDSRDGVNPLAAERCSTVDDDCDGLIDEADSSLDPALLTTYYTDADGDGFGDVFAPLDRCFQPDDAALNSDDCDDSTALLGLPADWYADADGDGYGSGVAVEFGVCVPSDSSLAPGAGNDCDDADPDRSPGTLEICEDGIDQNCSGADSACTMPTCADYLAFSPGSASGIYTLEPVSGGPVFDVYCDMTTDDGGWTLVASTAFTTMDDAAINYHGDLSTLTPSSAHTGIWDGLRPVFPGNTDIRFTCKSNVGDPDMRVDLSFYDTDWYREITSGTDADSCFNENNGIGQSAVPERRDNVTGATRALGDQWNASYLESEDSCTDTGDFTVDFDDRGMDSNQSDGTDWGEDDSTSKCGTSGSGNAWFIFVR